jgi:hypothetical protein
VAREARAGRCGHGGCAADPHTGKVALVERTHNPDRREIDDREHVRRRVHVHTDVGGPLRDDAGDRGWHIGRGLNLLPWRQGIDRRCREPEQYKPGSQALHAGPLRGMLGMKALDLLLTGRTNRDEFSGPSELLLVRVEFRLG